MEFDKDSLLKLGKLSKIKIDEELMLKKMIDYEKNKQLNQFSNIYFNKIKVNYSINEK